MKLKSTLNQSRTMGVVLPDPLMDRSGDTDRLPTVVFRSCYMGDGDQPLGVKLVEQFVDSLLKSPEPPVAMLFYNSAVLLLSDSSELAGKIKSLEARGSEILVCRTSFEQLAPGQQPAVGRICSMDDLLDAMNKADRLLWP